MAGRRLFPRRVAPPKYPTLSAKQKTKPPEPDADATNETTAAKTNLNAPKNNSPRRPLIFEKAAVPLVLGFLVAPGGGFPMR